MGNNLDPEVEVRVWLERLILQYLYVIIFISVCQLFLGAVAIAQCLSSMHEALGLVLKPTAKNKPQNPRNIRGFLGLFILSS